MDPWENPLVFFLGEEEFQVFPAYCVLSIKYKAKDSKRFAVTPKKDTLFGYNPWSTWWNVFS